MTNIIKLNIEDKEVCSSIKKQINFLIETNNIKSETDGKSSTGENIKQYELCQYIGNFLYYCEIIEDNLKLNGFLKRDDYLMPNSCWTVIGDKDSFHTIHKHNNSRNAHLSTVLYLSIPKNDKNRPGSFYAIDGDDVVTIDPLVGNLLIFPTDMYHGTYPQGPGIRQTFNMDFKVIQQI